MIDTLKPLERRVLGVLLEKHLAQPTCYPMTLNAVVAACNQKSNRDPVLELDERDVIDVLEDLHLRKLIDVELPGAGGRTKRYKYNLAGYPWDKREKAVIAELLLRGPQTVGELRTRGSRMTAFPDLESVMATLDRLMQSTPPSVRELPKEPGRSAVRFAHCFYPESEEPLIAASPEEKPDIPRTVADEIRETMESLRADINDLRAEVTELKLRLESLEIGRDTA